MPNQSLHNTRATQQNILVLFISKNLDSGPPLQKRAGTQDIRVRTGSDTPQALHDSRHLVPAVRQVPSNRLLKEVPEA